MSYRLQNLGVFSLFRFDNEGLAFGVGFSLVTGFESWNLARANFSALEDVGRIFRLDRVDDLFLVLSCPQVRLIV